MTQTVCEPCKTADTVDAPYTWQGRPLRVRDIMSASPVTITPKTSVHEARHLMQRLHIRHLPILEGGRLVGIVTDRDIRLVLPSPATRSLSEKKVIEK